MADRRSPLAHLGAAVIERDDLRLVEASAVGKINLRGDPSDAAWLAAVLAAVDIDLPQAPNTSNETLSLSVLWLAPDEWMLVCAGGSESEVVETLEGAVKDAHSAATDVTDAHTVFRLSGAGARDLLAKGCALDLHPRAFGLGDVVQTLLAKATVILHQTADDTDDAVPVFDIYVPRSFANYLWTWLADTIQ